MGEGATHLDFGVQYSEDRGLFKIFSFDPGPVKAPAFRPEDAVAVWMRLVEPPDDHPENYRALAQELAAETFAARYAEIRVPSGISISFFPAAMIFLTCSAKIKTRCI